MSVNRGVRWSLTVRVTVFSLAQPVGLTLLSVRRGASASIWLTTQLAVAVLPPFLLLLGGGMLAGRVHRGCLFALIPLVLLLAVWTPSEALDLFGTAFFAGYPASLSVLDPGFSLPAGQAAGRALASLAGMAMAVFSFRQAGRKKAA